MFIEMIHIDIQRQFVFYIQHSSKIYIEFELYWVLCHDDSNVKEQSICMKRNDIIEMIKLLIFEEYELYLNQNWITQQ